MSIVVGKPLRGQLDSLGNGFATLDGIEYYKIADVDQMEPFFINVVSHCDVWMFVSSRGGITAGRVDAEQALFPYETVDRLHDAHHHTGSSTQIWIHDDSGIPSEFWEPFVETRPGDTQVRRNLYKSLAGNRLLFEEIDVARQLTFRTGWVAASDLGIVRTTQLVNHSDEPIRLSVFDGMRNVLPWGVPLATYQIASTLADAYKRTECDAESGLGIFALTSGISDLMHPVEVLRANIVWSTGLPGARVCLTDEAWRRFRRGESPPAESLQAGQRGNYFVTRSELEISPGEQLTWHLVADVGYGHVQLVDVRCRLLNGALDGEVIEDRVATGTADLVANIASADGLQQSSDKIANVHHFANVLFNNMRGGVFIDNHVIQASDFREFVATRNAVIAARHRDELECLPPKVSTAELARYLCHVEDPCLQRLAYEYLPLTFSRRHGDPSRPWNRFSIRVKDAQGKAALRYEGNWRDIFQNWEALCVSFPGFLESVLSKFLNGSTVDGFNPYRVTDQGMEWETPNPEDPWSNIGYWGDHQIVYLLKLLEAIDDRQPDRLSVLLGTDRFAYLDVPYRLKPYAQLKRNARETIDFDEGRAREVAVRVAILGEDGKLLPQAGDSDHTIRHVNLAEKLLIPLLSKLSNFVLGGGIWMNTQRPEWNDANNALVGNGVSLVTLCYLRRYLDFLRKLWGLNGADGYWISSPVAGWWRAIHRVLSDLKTDTAGPQGWTAAMRLTILDRLGAAFCEYRGEVYAHGMGDREYVAASELESFCELAEDFSDLTIRANQREDRMFHAYNLLQFNSEGLQLRHLYEMLEGQVAVLSSGTLTPLQSISLIDELFASRMYREDAQSFMLYPARPLPDFLDRNVIPVADYAQNELLQRLVTEGNADIISCDGMGVYRFQADLRDGRDVRDRLARLQVDESWKSIVKRQADATVTLFDRVFQHASYTGRSGTMYGYEGIGCIYWHMVSKLLLAVQESYFRAVDQAASETIVRRLAESYYRIRDGLGPAKSPQSFGAFPTDPYSHTPGHSGAKQPGMTGQVKEEILTRFGELGVRIRSGRLSFTPSLLRDTEFSQSPATFPYIDQRGQSQSISLPADALAFTYCQVPIVYRRPSSAEPMEVIWQDGRTTDFSTPTLDTQSTERLLMRNGDVRQITVRI